MFNKHNTFLGIHGNKDRMLRTQRWCLDLRVNQLTAFQKEALDCCQKRWMLSPTAVRSSEPFGAPNFARVLSRVPRYVACVQTCGVQWMGLWFWYPILWLPAEVYTAADWWKEFLLSGGFKVPRIEMALEYDLAGLHETYSLQNPDLRRWQTT